MPQATTYITLLQNQRVTIHTLYITELLEMRTYAP
jgi:hypothetical protein